ncbi:NAD-dependent epimerase/dehydratase family protein [Methylocapsa polymorpha]|uniref:NAD-dependent epimerase/dehydratase family protein n=1 Tax=Methylocapsa polymorpha TaxID=3080828 RepID=A0ABZ0HV17_9HYPH|nr:NAD-dependent epimerase/dehydratase family protein [Methylocapsa sp. RX1]
MTARVLVTGASGFLGRALVPALLGMGESVIAIGRRASPFPPHSRLIWHEVDLAESAVLIREILRGVNTIYHLSWSTIPSESNLAPSEDARVNIIGSLRLLENVERGARPRVVFASSGGTVYGRLLETPAPEDHPLNPLSAYGVSKRAVESYLDFFARLGDIRPISLRIGNVFGPGQDATRVFGAVTHFARSALSGAPIRLFGDGSVVRDYVYIEDAIDALVRAGHVETASPALNIGSGVGRSLNDVIAALQKHFHEPIKVERMAARAFDAPVSVLDPTRARREIGWSPRVSFEDGVRRTLASLAKIAT